MLCGVPEGLTLKTEKVDARVVLHHDGYLYEEAYTYENASSIMCIIIIADNSTRAPR
jgi:hypothetical protein